MYNRYIRNDDGVYARQVQPQPESQRRQQDVPPPPPPHRPEPPPRQHEPPPPSPKGGIQFPFLSGILEKLHLGSIDFGDLLLLLLLFQLFREDGDEELLIAIGLLLIL